MRKKRIGKAFAVLVSAVLTASMVITPVFASSKIAAKKDETVYVKMDAQGNQESVTVSDYLKNTKKYSKISDKTNLSKVENVKGDETYKTGKTNDITWNANGKDIYYQGKTDKELPVGMAVIYYLDGKEISPDKIVGKSGKVKIKYQFTNNSPKTVKIDGKDTTLYTPFVVVTGAILPTEHFSNVKIDNGKVISDGTKHIVIGVSFPGLNQSLNLNDTNLNIDMPESFEITADAKDFELNVTASVASADMLSDLGLDDSADLSDLQDSLNKLKESSKKLVDGSGKLLKGVKTLQSSTKEFNSGIKKVDKNMKKLSKGLNTLDTKNGELVTGAKQVASGANKVASGSKALNKGTQELEDKTKSLPASTKTINNGMIEILTKVKAMQPSDGETKRLEGAMAASEKASADAETRMNKIKTEIGELGSIAKKAGENAKTASDNNDTASATAWNQTATALQTQIQKLTEDATALGDDLTTIKPTFTTIATKLGNVNGSMPELVAGLTRLQGGTAQLAGESTTLTNGIKSVNKGAGDLASGSKTLASGSKQVASGAKQIGAGISTAASGGKQLSKGTGQLSNAGDQLVSGVGTLVSGTKTLNDGMIQFDKEGIEKMVDLVNENAKGVLDRAEQLVDLGNEYQSFTKKAKGTSGTVKFMMETEEVQ